MSRDKHALEAALLASLDREDQLAAATFEQTFAALAATLDLSPHRGAATEETTEIERLDAVTFALDKLPRLDPHRVTDLPHKSAALAALLAATAGRFQALGVCLFLVLLRLRGVPELPGHEVVASHFRDLGVPLAVRAFAVYAPIAIVDLHTAGDARIALDLRDLIVERSRPQPVSDPGNE